MIKLLVWRERTETLGEEIANSISHGVGFLASLAAAPFLVIAAVQNGGTWEILGASVFSVTANRFGTDRRPHGEVRFTGRSQIVGTRGELLFRAPAQREVVHVQKIDPARGSTPD